jgi:hypothetical protein
MRLCPPGGNDANDGASYRVSDDEHPAIYHANGIEAPLVFNIAVLKFDNIRSKKTLEAVSKSRPCFFRFTCSLASSHSNFIGEASLGYTEIQ